MCDYKYFLITFRDLYLAFTLCMHHVSFIMIKLENRFQKHTAKAMLAGRLVTIHAQFALLFTNISILYRQNCFSIHSSVKVQEEQINMPKQDLQNLGDEAHFPRAQKLQNKTEQFITFFILMPESIFFSAKSSALKILKSLKSILYGVKSTTPVKGSSWTW